MSALPKTTTRRAVEPCDLHGTDHAHYDPSAGTCCRDCGAKFFGTRACHCVGCHETFAGEKAFTWHALKAGCRPPGECLTEDGDPVLELVAGYWSVVREEER